MLDVTRLAELYKRIQEELSKVIVGKSEVKRALMLCLMAGGHLLIEGVPGTAKTKVAVTFAEVIGLNFKRIQFTPDMMPGDITGFDVYSPDGTSKFIEGPIFANLVLGDELNRTTPRTQSALLEAMQESQVTVEGRKYPLSKPFMVVATQVAFGGEGTYPLTDVQADRFLLRVGSGYPSKDEEKRIIGAIDQIDEPDVSPVTNMEEIMQLQRFARTVHVSPDIVEYTVSIIDRLRTDPDTIWGPSVRGTIAIYKCARVLALMDGRDFVIPDDIKSIAFDAIEHRLKVKPEAELDGITPRTIIERAINEIPVPRLAL